MYTGLLLIHSWFRWLVLISLVYAIYRAYRGWLSGKDFTPFDDKVRHNTATISHVQLLLGLWLYFISPLIHYFFSHFKESLGDRDIRFFAMEHNLMMLVAIVFISAGSVMAKRKAEPRSKFKAMALWFTFTLIIILVSIPWSFSPMASRPLFRLF